MATTFTTGGVADAILQGKSAVTVVPEGDDEFVELDEAGKPKPAARAGAKKKAKKKVVKAAPKAEEVAQEAAPEAAEEPAAEAPAAEEPAAGDDSKAGEGEA